MWSAEDVIGEFDLATGMLIEERRTDIVYGWNDDAQGMRSRLRVQALGPLRHRHL
jgi:hypothetical protein